MTIKLKNMTIRIKDETLRDIEEITNIEKSDKSTVARKLLAKGLQEYKKERAIELYRKGKCTLWKASQIADVSLREIIEITKNEKIPMHLSAEVVEEAWSKAFEE